MVKMTKYYNISTCSKNEFKASIPFLLVALIVISKTTAFSTEHRDVALMAHVIGSGAMNIDHYFHSLGVACENRNSGFWKIIEQDRQKCMQVRDSSNGRSYYASLPQGSFEKMCRNWKNNEICNINFARDLNDCLGRSSRGSDALEFMEAYFTFSCRNIRDTESQLSTHTRRHTPTNSPGVFKCFPETQDRILTCVKEDTFSNSLCSQFSTVELCFSRFYKDYRNCNDIGVVEYLRDLFRSMAFAMKCSGSGQTGWNNVLEHYLPKPIEPVPHYKYPLSPNSHGSSLASKPYNPQHKSWIEVPPTVTSTAFKAPYSQMKGSNSILLLPKPLLPVKEPTYWEQPQLLVPNNVPIIESPPGDTSSYNPPLSPHKEEESPLGAWFNLQQQKFSQKTGEPGWAWGYERYAPSPQDNKDRFYSYRVEPQPQQRKDEEEDLEIDHGRGGGGGGVYDLYQVHYDRYGMPPPPRPPPRPPLSRGLSNRRPHQNLRKPKVILMDDEDHHPILWDLHDNHFRKFKDDHMFHMFKPPQSSTPRIGYPRFTHSVPTSFPNKKRKVQIFVKDNDEDKGPIQDYKIIIISNTTVAPRTQIKKSDRRSSYIGVQPDYVPYPEQSTTITTTTLFQNPQENDGQFVTATPVHFQSQHYLPNNATTSKPKIFRPKILENQSGFSPQSILLPTTQPKYRSRNVTYSFPPWPRGNTKNWTENPDQTTHPTMHFDSKRVLANPSRISTSTPKSQQFPDLDLDEQTTPTSAIRPKILRKIKVRKRPSSTSTIIPEDY